MDDSFMINLFKLEHCIRHHSQKVIFLVSKDLYYNHPITKKGTEKLARFCRGLGLKESRKKYIFGKSFPDNFEYNFYAEETQHDLDISFCFKMIDLLQNQNESTELGTLVSSIDQIKELRNKIRHETVREKVLSDLKTELNTALVNISDSMGSILKKTNFEHWNSKEEDYYEKLVRSKIKTINKMWEANLVIESELEKLMKCFDNKLLLETFVSSCQGALVEVYQNFITASDILRENDSNVFMSNVFVPLSLDTVNGKTVPCHKILTAQSKKNIIILGDVGQGKTALCKNLIYEWCQVHKWESQMKDQAMVKYHLLLLIETKDSEETQLAGYLKKLLLPNLSFTSDDTIYQFLRKLNILIIIDSLNEASEKGLKLIDNCLDLLSSHKFIITTRDCYSDKAVSLLKCHDIGHTYQEYYLQGFEEQIKNLPKILSERKDQDNFQKFFQSLPIQFQNELDFSLANILLHLWVKKGKKNVRLEMLSSIYMELVNCAKQEGRKELIDDVVDHVAEDCYQKLTKETIESKYIDEAVIKGIQTHLESNNLSRKEIEKIFSSLFLITPTLKNDEGRGYQYEFLHKTQAKWLAAEHAQKLLTERDLNVCHKLKSILNKKEGSDIVAFTLGILNAGNELKPNIISKIMEEKEISNFLKEHNYHYLWKIVRETLKTEPYSNSVQSINSEMSMVLQKRRIQCDFKKWILNENNGVGALFLVQFTSLQPEIMQIELKDPDKSKSFLSAMKELNEAYMKKRNNDSKIAVSLHFQQPTEKVGSAADFLGCLSGWANLVEFSGYINDSKITSLAEFTTLRELTLYVTNHEALTLLCDVCKVKPQLLKIGLIINRALSRAPKSKNCYNFGKAKVSLEFTTFQSWRDVTYILETLRQSIVAEVIIKCAAQIPNDIAMAKLREIILKEGKLIILAGCHINEEMYEKLRNNLGCKLRWNEYYS